VTEYLLQEAEPTEGSFHVVGRRRAAIKALAKHDHEAAYDAAKSALRQGRYDRHLYPEVLIEVDSERAIPILCNHLVREQDPRVRRAVCLALRHSGRREQLESAVKGLLLGTAFERHAAAEILGWQGNGFLIDELQEHSKLENIGWVRGVFLSSLALRAAELKAREVLHALSEASQIDQWRLVDALFESSPPECLGCKDDQLWIGRLFDRLPPILQEHTNQRYRDSLDQIKREMNCNDE
jgi:hypothetical protein